MFSITRLRNRKESDRMVAAAGFMLKQENMKASPRMMLALKARNACDSTKSLKPCEALRTLNTIPGQETKRPPQGNQMRAKQSAEAPSTTTRTAEKTTPASHFAISRRTREMGRDNIIRKVPSSASFATRSPPTKAAYNGMSRMICGISITNETDSADTKSEAK